MGTDFLMRIGEIGERGAVAADEMTPPRGASGAPAQGAPLADRRSRIRGRRSTRTRRRRHPPPPGSSAGRASPRARTLAMYGEAFGRLQRFVAAQPVALREVQVAPRAALGGAAARAGPRAAQHRDRAVGLARAVPLAGPRGAGRVQPGRGGARAARRPSRCRRRCRSTMRWRSPSTDADDRPTRRSTRATTASSSCSTAAGCASASWSGSTCRPAARPRAGSTPPTPAHTCSARAASGAACRSAARARCTRALARAARHARCARRAGAVRQQPRHASDRQSGALAPEGRALCRPGCRPTCTRTCCATRSPRTCCNPAATCAPCRSCWATPTSRRRRSTRGWTSGTCRKVYDAAHPRARRR